VLLNPRPTQPFSKSVVERIQADPEFAQAFWQEAVQLFLSGEPVMAKLLLRDLVNATVGFEELAERINKPSKSVHRMLSLSGNPTMDNLSVIFAAVKPALVKKLARTRAAA
jgi:DNA-binding phage protein